MFDMADDSPSPSVISTSQPASSHAVFHEDDCMHPCHPLQVYPYNILRSLLVSVSSDGTRNGSCRRTILVALSVRNKLDFVNDCSVKPPDNDSVVSWLTNSLSKKIACGVEYSELAKDIWGKLEERYGQADAGKIFELKKELAHIS